MLKRGCSEDWQNGDPAGDPGTGCPKRLRESRSAAYRPRQQLGSGQTPRVSICRTKPFADRTLMTEGQASVLCFLGGHKEGRRAGDPWLRVERRERIIDESTSRILSSKPYIRQVGGKTSGSVSLTVSTGARVITISGAKPHRLGIRRPLCVAHSSGAGGGRGDTARANAVWGLFHLVR